MDRPTIDALEHRIRESAEAHNGSIPSDVALVWEGYFAALLEWGLISVADHACLLALLPETPSGPALGVFLGWKRLPEQGEG